MVNIGIIGLGYWGPNILRNLTKVSDSNVTYCCDINPSRYDQIKKIYPWIKYTKDSNEIINSSDVDAVAIVTPVNTHYNLVKDALEADKHVLVSKPLTDNISSAEELVEISNKKNLVLHVDHTFLFHPAVNKIKKIISKGELGELYYIDSIRINLGLFQHDISVIWDLAPHDVSIMQYLVEQPVEWVQATGACHAGQDFESMAYITIQFKNKVIGHCHINWLAPMKVRLTTIVGSSKMVVYDDNLVAEKVKIYDSGVTVNTVESMYEALIQYRKGDIYSPVIDSTEALEIEANHFIDCILNTKKSISDGITGLEVMKIIDAAQKSIRNEGKRIIMNF